MDAGGVARSHRRSSAGRRRRVWVVTLLVLLAATVFVAEAQAYVSGDLIYAKRIGTATSPAGSWSVAAGADGATIVAGWKWSATLDTYLPMVAKYSVSGERLWLRTYTEFEAGTADAVAVDANGNIYVAATVGTGDALNIVLVRYGSAGTFKWARTYNGPAGLVDYVEALVIDPAGNVIVVGQSQATADDWGCVALKYDKLGTMLWAEPARFDPDPMDPNAGNIWVSDAARDAGGNIYVAGSSAYRDGDEWIESALMLKFAAADGARAWSQTYTSATNPQCSFEQVAVRGTLVVGVGGTWINPQDAVVVRYNTSGVQKYARQWGAGNTTSEWYGDVVMDGSYNVYVTGGQWSDDWERCVTMKLRPDLTTVWKATYLPSTEWAEGWYIARNSLGNVYVAGVRWAPKPNQLADIMTIKYSATGARRWVRVWSAGGPDNDYAEGLVLGTAGGVYVSGEVTNVYGYPQAVLLKYKL